MTDWGDIAENLLIWIIVIPFMVGVYLVLGWFLGMALNILIGFEITFWRVVALAIIIAVFK